MTTSPNSWARTVLLTTVALIAFAANSLLCREALGRGLIDPGSFTSLRLASGAMILAILLGVSGGKFQAPVGSWQSAAWLALYAAAFSFAYVSLSAGTGALVLFAAVQATMMIAAIRSGERPTPLKWIGIGLALSGLIYLLSPGLQAPSLVGAILMGCAGIAWGVYTVRGRGVSMPLRETAGNFLRATPIALAVSAATIGTVKSTWEGATLAVASGAVASGLGYVIWFAALRGLSTVRAATSQLVVPVLAALGGVLFLNENLTLRLVCSSVLILGGVALGLSGTTFLRKLE